MDPAADIARIVAFLRSIGIAATAGPITTEGFLPAIAIRDGALLFDPDRLDWPGDLLHEAGHIAVTEPARRAALTEVADDPVEEMAAIAWSYAAAMAIGLDPARLFHPAGYGGQGRAGDGDWLVAAFARGDGPGVPILAWWGMTALPGTADAEQARFPRLARWLR